MPGRWSAQISAEQWGVVMENEVATSVHGIFPLPLDVSEQVYRLGRGPRHHKPARIGVSQAPPRQLRFQPNDGVLQQKSRWPQVGAPARAQVSDTPRKNIDEISFFCCKSLRSR